jgi:hypothetical protein
MPQPHWPAVVFTLEHHHALLLSEQGVVPDFQGSFAI